MTTIHRLSGGTLGLALLAFSAGCDSGEPEPINPEEFITDVTITLTNDADASDTVTITASDDDGDGAGLTFSPARISLRQGALYSGTIEISDEINDESITEEIEEEAEEHLFVYAVSPASAGEATITDTESDYVSGDENNGDFNVGLAFNLGVNSAASGQGTLNATLYHFDEEPKTGNNATSDEIDIDIDFPVQFGPPTLAGDPPGN